MSAPVPAADASPEVQVVERILDRDTGELLDLSPGALCAQCAGTGYTCCQPEYGVTITFHDARRLMEHTGQALADFAHVAVIDDQELLEGLKVDKEFRPLFLGKRRLLQTIQHGLDCHFLGEGGCTVFEHRPRLCHFHPFWFRTPDGKKPAIYYDAVDDRDDADEADCLVVNKIWPNRELGLRSIGEDDASLGAHAAQMREEIAWQHAQVQELLKTHKAKDLTVEVLEPVVKKAPFFEV